MVPFGGHGIRVHAVDGCIPSWVQYRTAACRLNRVVTPIRYQWYCSVVSSYCIIVDFLSDVLSWICPMFVYTRASSCVVFASVEIASRLSLALC